MNFVKWSFPIERRDETRIVYPTQLINYFSLFQYKYLYMLGTYCLFLSFHIYLCVVCVGNKYVFFLSYTIFLRFGRKEIGKIVMLTAVFGTIPTTKCRKIRC